MSAMPWTPPNVSQQLHRTARYGGCRKGSEGAPQAGCAAMARKPLAASPRRSPVLRRDGVYQSRAGQRKRPRPCERATRAAMLASWREIPRCRHPPLRDRAEGGEERERLDVEPHAVHVAEAAAGALDVGVALARHDQPLEAEAQTHPGVDDAPVSVQGEIGRAH